MNNQRIAIISVPVTNQQAAKTFYTELLGFRVMLDTSDEEQRWVELAPPGGGATITLVTWFSQMPPGSLQGLVIDTDAIEQVAGVLRARGVDVSPVEPATGGLFARLNDPDGNGLVLRQRSAA